MAILNLSEDTSLIIDQNQNLLISDTAVPVKAVNFKINNVVADTATMEIITKDSNDIKVNDQIVVSDQNAYFVKTIDKTPVKFGSGTPLITQTTNVTFPRPETSSYTQKKVATFLIFKK